MNDFDEYQKLIRYQYGTYSFILLLVLTFVNYFLSFIFEIQWAETKELEFMLLAFISVLYFTAMSVYKGAYFRKKQRPTVNASLFTLVGLINIYISVSSSTPLIKNGQVTFNSITLVSGLFLITVPIAYLTRIIVEKRKEAE